jgi:hypothetical protein
MEGSRMGQVRHESATPQPSIPHMILSALHRCLQRHGIARLPGVEGDKPKR